MAKSDCAHCSDGRFPGDRDSNDYGRRSRCPACAELVCPSCRAKSGPTVCGTHADGDENMTEIRRTENKLHRRGRRSAQRRRIHHSDR